MASGAPQGVWGAGCACFPGAGVLTPPGVHTVSFGAGTQGCSCLGTQLRAPSTVAAAGLTREGPLSIYFCCFSFQDEIKLHKENPSLLLQHCISTSLEGKTLTRRFSCTLLVLVSPLSAFRTLTPGPFPTHCVWCFGVCFFFFLLLFPINFTVGLWLG